LLNGYLDRGFAAAINAALTTLFKLELFAASLGMRDAAPRAEMAGTP
jgi:hypothetical protein